MKKSQMIDRIGKSIRSKDPNAEIFLFGSRARGDNRKDSDWDVLILIDNNKVTNEMSMIAKSPIRMITTDMRIPCGN
jgi:predicted nucleotidyltransferase